MEKTSRGLFFIAIAFIMSTMVAPKLMAAHSDAKVAFGFALIFTAVGLFIASARQLFRSEKSDS